eukprot:6464474-Amphidinium_carterae.1
MPPLLTAHKRGVLKLSADSPDLCHKVLIRLSELTYRELLCQPSARHMLQDSSSLVPGLSWVAPQRLALGGSGSTRRLYARPPLEDPLMGPVGGHVNNAIVFGSISECSSKRMLFSFQ